MHHEKTAMRKRQFTSRSREAITGLQLKLPGGSKTHRGNHRSRSKHCFIIAMPVHTVSAIPIQIRQDSIEPLLTQCLQSLGKLAQRFWPGQGSERNTGIGVLGAGIAIVIL